MYRVTDLGEGASALLGVMKTASAAALHTAVAHKPSALCRFLTREHSVEKRKNQVPENLLGPESMQVPPQIRQ